MPSHQYHNTLPVHISTLSRNSTSHVCSHLSHITASPANISDCLDIPSDTQNCFHRIPRPNANHFRITNPEAKVISSSLQHATAIPDPIVTNDSSKSKSATQEVFGIVELHEKILLELPQRDILDHLHTDAKLIQAVQGSVKLQQKLFLVQKPEVLLEADKNNHSLRFRLAQAVWKPNMHLFDSDSQTLNKKYLHASSRFRIVDTQHEYSLNIVPRKKDGRPESQHTFLLVRHQKHHSQTPNSRILSPAYLSTFLSDSATPVAMRIRHMPSRRLASSSAYRLMNRTRRNYMAGTKHVWVPVGKTLCDILKWTEAYLAGTIARGVVVDGVFQFQWAGRQHSSTGDEDVEEMRMRGWWVLEHGGK